MRFSTIILLALPTAILAQDSIGTVTTTATIANSITQTMTVPGSASISSISPSALSRGNTTLESITFETSDATGMMSIFSSSGSSVVVSGTNSVSSLLSSNTAAVSSAASELSAQASSASATASATATGGVGGFVPNAAGVVIAAVVALL